MYAILGLESTSTRFEPQHPNAFSPAESNGSLGATFARSKSHVACGGHLLPRPTFHCPGVGRPYLPDDDHLSFLSQGIAIENHQQIAGPQKYTTTHSGCHDHTAIRKLDWSGDQTWERLFSETTLPTLYRNPDLNGTGFSNWNLGEIG